MQTRKSALTGEQIKVPMFRDPAPALAAQIADLRVQLATAEAQRDAEKRRADDAEARCQSLQTDVQAANARAEALSVRQDPPQTVVSPPAPPVAYDVIVTKRDGDRLSQLKILPVTA